MNIKYLYFESIFVLVLNYHKILRKKVFLKFCLFLWDFINFFEIPNIKIGKELKNNYIFLNILLMFLKQKIIW